MNTHRFVMDYVSDTQNPLYLYIPYADLRFKMAGGGQNYVHGGLTLQETVIPALLLSIRPFQILTKKGLNMEKLASSLSVRPGRLRIIPLK